jgi:hypothetical protein
VGVGATLPLPHPTSDRKATELTTATNKEILRFMGILLCEWTVAAYA